MHNKRLSAPKHYPIGRKENSYVVTIKGSRSGDQAIPVLLFLREVTGYAENKKEAKKIIKDGRIFRNGERIRDIREGVGVLDVIEIPETEETFRVVKKNKKLLFVPVTDGEKVVAKILDKAVEEGEFVYRLHNGENHRTDKEYSTQNTLVFKNGNVKEVALEEGGKALVTEGAHAGEVAEINSIEERGMNPDTARVESDYEFETRLDNLVAIEELEVTMK